MEVQDAIGQAYKNGYEDGKKDAVKWISVKDRLPNLDEAVLVHAEYLHIKTNYYEVWSLFRRHGGELIWVDKYGDGHKLTEVTHWMPLPEPPKGE